MRNDLSAAYVRSILRYDARTGRIYWRRNGGRARTGKRAGTVSGRGYRYVQIDGIKYAEHRIIWLIVKGRWPSKHLDHIDTDSINNKFGNLRQAGGTQNQANTRRRSDNLSGIKGVYWNPSRHKWQVQIQVGRRKRFLGRFAKHEKKKAAAAYLRAARAAFGEFARAA